MENDDKLVGQILSRREALKILGVGSAAFLTAGAIHSNTIDSLSSITNSPLDCVVRPELTIGTHFIDDQLNRSDIRSEPSDHSIKTGVPLKLNILVSSLGQRSCTPLQGAKVDIWHCDALGYYSGITNPAFDTTGLKYLRSYQMTNEKGAVQFQTIYPGWYSGRAVHIHFTIRTKGLNTQDYQFTSQLFFDDLVTDKVHTLKPYADKPQRNTRNQDDALFNAGGRQLLLNLQGNTITGIIGAIHIGLDLADNKVGASDIKDSRTRPVR
jgi:protocatechuate 3,4-dioxygenase beta subunit